MKKPSLQQAFWHSGGVFFLPSFLHFFLHFFIDFGGFFSHFLVLILHASSSLRPPQLTSGSEGDGGADGGSGSHKPQVFVRAFFFSRSLQCLFLHFFFAVSTHAGGLGDGCEGLGGDGDGGGGEGLGGGGEGECCGGEGLGGGCEGSGEGDIVSTVTSRTQTGSSAFIKDRVSLFITFCTVWPDPWMNVSRLRRRRRTRHPHERWM